MQLFDTAPLSVLCPGVVLGSPVYEQADQRTKLVGADVVISETLLSRLKQRGVSSVFISQSDLARLSAFKPQGTAANVYSSHDFRPSKAANSASNALDDELDLIKPMEIDPTEAFLNSVDSIPDGLYDEERAQHFAKQNEQRVAFLDGMFRELVQTNSSTDINPINDLCRTFLRDVSQDIDQFVCLSANPYSSDYPHRHGLHVASLALAIGAKLGHNDRSLLDLAKGCLIHDIGMLRLPFDAQSLKRKLSDEEVEQLTSHPILTLESIEPQLDALSFLARAVVYQVHERCDGSGYPRQRFSHRIHELSRIAAVADTFVALSSKRPHRTGLMPYHVIVHMLQQVREGKLDAEAMRGLLRTLSLFPIGSFIELSDGRIGRVIRANGNAFNQPIVEVWNSGRLVGQPSVVDLVEHPDLEIVKPLEALTP